MAQPDEPPIQTALTGGYRLLREYCARCDLTGGPFAETVVRFSGEDRRGWLQGQLTNDLRNFGEGGSIRAAILTPTGQIVSTIHLWAMADSYLALIPAARADAALQRLEQMLILEDVLIERLDWPITTVQGPEASAALSQNFDLPRLDAGQTDDAALLRNDRTGSGGWDVLSARQPSLLQIPESDSTALDILRIEAGIPVHGRDIGERTLVMELGRRFIESHVSLQKGCYTGQEVVMRIHSRGHTNRTWMGLLAEGALTEGATVSSPERDDAGVVTSAAVSPELGHIGAAMLRSEVAREGASVTVGGIAATVAEMPLRD